MGTEPIGSVQVLPPGSRIRRLNAAERSRRDAAAPPDPYSGGYGLDEVMALLRRLPDHGLEQVTLIVRVIKATLESAGVTLPPIIDAALHRLADREDHLDRLAAEIDALHTEIGERQAEIARLEGELAETTMVRDRLELAMRPRT